MLTDVAMVDRLLLRSSSLQKTQDSLVFVWTWIATFREKNLD